MKMILRALQLHRLKLKWGIIARAIGIPKSKPPKWAKLLTKGKNPAITRKSITKITKSNSQKYFFFRKCKACRHSITDIPSKLKTPPLQPTCGR